MLVSCFSLLESEHSPLWSITHRNDELQAHDQDAGVTQNNEDVFPYVVSERVNLLVR
jgi:hypothetical protein